MIENELIKLDDIQSRIYTIRGVQVMLDKDLSSFYDVETRSLNQAVKRNIARFPSEFCFQLTSEEFNNWKSQIVISNSIKMGLRKLHFVFTEQGVAMLSAVLKSETAVRMSIQIIKAFVAMRHFVLSNAQIFQRLDSLETWRLGTDPKIEKVLTALENRQLQPKQGIFFDGQIFDAHVFVSDLIRSAEKSIVLIDIFVDDTVLTLFSKRKSGVHMKILTKTISTRTVRGGPPHQ